MGSDSKIPPHFSEDQRQAIELQTRSREFQARIQFHATALLPVAENILTWLKREPPLGAPEEAESNFNDYKILTYSATAELENLRGSFSLAPEMIDYTVKQDRRLIHEAVAKIMIERLSHSQSPTLEISDKMISLVNQLTDYDTRFTSNEDGHAIAYTAMVRAMRSSLADKGR